jgi:hypothetical protein
LYRIPADKLEKLFYNKVMTPRKKIVSIAWGGLAALLIAPLKARGAQIRLENPLRTDDPIELLGSIVDWLIIAGAPIAVVMVIYGAFQIMTAQGDTEKFTSGRKTIVYAIVGYGIIICAWGIVAVIQSVLEE